MSTVSVAILDESGLLIGYDDVSLDTIGPDHVIVPTRDLGLRQYRYDFNAKAFTPLTRQERRLQDTQPDNMSVNMLRIMALGFKAVRDGQPLPSEVLDWLAWCERQFKL